MNVCMYVYDRPCCVEMPNDNAEKICRWLG